MLTRQQLITIMPNLATHAATGALLSALQSAMAEAEITTPKRAAAFLAQLAHESVELTVLEELPHRKTIAGCRLCQRRGPHDAGVQYEGRGDLGNVKPGDGVRYKGRGPIQLTGRANYRDFGKKLGVDLEAAPDLAAEPEVGMRVAALYWSARRLNAKADAGDFEGITRAINGGTNGLADRERYWARAKKALGVA